MRKKDVKQLLVEIPVELFEELEKYCAKHTKFKGGVVREAIETLLEHERDSTSRFIVELPETLADDLSAFRAAHYNATRDGVVQSALRDHIERALEDAHTNERYQKAKKKAETNARSNLRSIIGNKSR